MSGHLIIAVGDGSAHSASIGAAMTDQLSAGDAFRNRSRSVIGSFEFRQSEGDPVSVRGLCPGNCRSWY